MYFLLALLSAPSSAAEPTTPRRLTTVELPTGAECVEERLFDYADRVGAEPTRLRRQRRLNRVSMTFRATGFLEVYRARVVVRGKGEDATVVRIRVRHANSPIAPAWFWTNGAKKESAYLIAELENASVACTAPSDWETRP